MNMRAMQTLRSKLKIVLLSAFLTLIHYSLMAVNMPATDEVAAVFAQDQVGIADTAEVLAFAYDVDGDGVWEYFTTLAGFKNGRRGNIWTVYSGVPPDIGIIGDAQFPPSFVVPYDGHTLSSPKGLYTYWPGDQQKGRLVCFTMAAGRIVEKELGDIEPYGKDKILFNTLFADAHRSGNSFELRSYKMRELIVMPIKKMGPSNASANSGAALTSVERGKTNSSTSTSSAPDLQLANSTTRNGEMTILINWSIIAVVTLAIFGLLLFIIKRR